MGVYLFQQLTMRRINCLVLIYFQRISFYKFKNTRHKIEILTYKEYVLKTGGVLKNGKRLKCVSRYIRN